MSTLIAVAIVANLSACSDEPETEPVTIGSAPATAGPAITLDRELDEFGAFREWPSACDMVTDDTLQAFLPQIDEITRTPEEQEYQVHAEDLTSVPGGIFVPEARCKIAFHIPVGMLDSNEGYVHLDVLAAGSEEFVGLNLDKAEGTAMDVEGGECEAASDGIRCLDESKQLHFRMSFQLPHHGPSLKDPSRYEAAGETVSFTTDNKDTEARNEFIESHLTQPILQSILDRLHK